MNPFLEAQRKRQDKPKDPGFLAKYQKPVKARTDMQRILELPLKPEWKPEWSDLYSQRYILAQAYAEGFRLHDQQAQALHEFLSVGGLVGPIGVGFGKTIISLLCASAAYDAGEKHIVLLVPPHVYSQLMIRDVPRERRRIYMPYMIHGLQVGREMRRRIVERRQPGLYVVPYSMVSTTDGYETLMRIGASVVICDEAHNLKNRRAARTRRFLSYLEHTETQPRGAVLSGTLTSKSLGDYHHLARWVLGDACPLPMAAQTAMDWANILDAEASPARADLLLPLITWAQRTFGEVIEDNVDGYRRAYQLRFTNSPGVVSTGDRQIGTSLVIVSVAPPVENTPQRSELRRLQKQVTDTWLTPNGDEIDHAIHKFRWLYELSAGFYNRLYWPSGEQLKEAHPNTYPDERSALLALTKAKDHLAASSAFAKALRTWFQNDHVPGLDTPLLVTRELAQHGAKRLPSRLFDLWKEMHSLEWEGMPERWKQAVRVCDYKVQAAVTWAKKHKQGLIWYANRDVGKWLAEELSKSFTNVLHCPAGETYNAAITDPENRHKLIVASWRAHGEGKNIQHHQNNLVVQWPRGHLPAEQMIGRTHRVGQEADEIVIHRLQDSEHWFDREMFSACLSDACYYQGTIGVSHKLLYATHDPPPEIFPDSYLRQKGFETYTLSAQQRERLRSLGLEQDQDRTET